MDPDSCVTVGRILGELIDGGMQLAARIAAARRRVGSS
jgi:hypothetical protein